MPRNTRVDVQGEIFHIINRANARLQIFNTDEDYLLFEQVLEEAKKRLNIKLYSYCIMPNHWHLIISPLSDGDVAKFVGWLTMTHTQRWHSMHKSIGSGHLYQGRYKSFIIQPENYFLQACRYVERNPLRAKLIKNIYNWKWSSFWRREKGTVKQKVLLDTWPVTKPNKYNEWMIEVESKEVLDVLRISINKGKPYGADSWIDVVIKRFKLGSTLRPPGRPKKGS